MDLAEDQTLSTTGRKWLLPALAAVVAAWLALWLSGGVGSYYDPAILAAFYAGGNAAAAQTGAIFTQLGGSLVLTAVTVAAAILLASRGARHRALLLVAIVFSGRLLVELQKALIARPRPELDHFVTVHSASFPSGHAANSMITYLAVAMIAGFALSPGGRRGAIAAALILSFAIGLSRLVVGVHWPSDVVAGWLFGVAWVGLCLRISAPHIR